MKKCNIVLYKQICCNLLPYLFLILFVRKRNRKTTSITQGYVCVQCTIYITIAMLWWKAVSI